MSESLSPPNATPLMRALEEALVGETRATPSALRDLHDPMRCPEAVLPHLAWALSVDHWGEDWPIEIKRRVIAASIAMHRVKGSVGAVRRALEAVQAPVNIIEWWENGGAPHTFTASVSPGVALSDAPSNILFPDALTAELRRIIDAAKPLRSHYELRLRPPSRAVLRPAAGAAAQARSDLRARLIYPVMRGRALMRPAAGLAARASCRLDIKPRHAPARGRASMRPAAGLAARARVNIVLKG